MVLAAVAELLPDTTSANLARTGIVLLVGLVVWFLIFRLGRRLVTRVIERTTDTDTLEGKDRAARIATLWAAGKLLLGVLLAVLGVMVLFQIWGIPITPLLAIGSIIGVALGFGAQNLIRDVIAGLFILIEDQFSLGDVVSVAGVEGTVDEVRLRTTVLRDADGNTHHVPNGAIVVATNRTRGYARVVVDYLVGSTTDVDQVLALMAEEGAAMVADPEWHDVVSDPRVLGVEEVGGSIRLRMAMKVVPDRRNDSRRELLRRLKVRFDAESIPPP